MILRRPGLENSNFLSLVQTTRVFFFQFFFFVVKEDKEVEVVVLCSTKWVAGPPVLDKVMYISIKPRGSW